MKRRAQDALDAALARRAIAGEARAFPLIPELVSVATRVERLAPPSPDPTFVVQLGTLLELKAVVAAVPQAARQRMARSPWPSFRLGLTFAAAVLILLTLPSIIRRLPEHFNLISQQPAIATRVVRSHMEHVEELLLQAAHGEVDSVELRQVIVAYREAIMTVRAELPPGAEEAWLTDQREILQGLRGVLDATTYHELSQMLEPLDKSDVLPAETTSIRMPATTDVPTETPSTTRAVESLVRDSTATQTAESTEIPQVTATPTQDVPTPTLPEQTATQQPQPVQWAEPTIKPVPPAHPEHPTAHPTLVSPEHTASPPEHPTQAVGPPEEHSTSQVPDEHPTHEPGPPELPTQAAGPPDERPTSQAPEHPAQAVGPPEERPTQDAGPPQEHPTPRVPEPPEPGKPDTPGEPKPPKQKP